MPQLIVYRYKTKWAWGEARWLFEYSTYEDESEIKGLVESKVEDLDNQNSWSDKYRGAVVEIVKNPSLDTLKKFAKMEQDKIDSATQTLKILEREMKNAKDSSSSN